MKIIPSLFVACLFLLAVLPATAQDVDDLVILTEEYPPYNYMENGKVCGSATEVVVEVLDRLGSKLGRKDIRLIPWARAYQEVRNAKNAILYVMTRTEERMNVFKWVCPVGNARIGVVARKRDRVVINKPEDFERYRIGVVREDVGHQLMLKLVPEKDLDIANSSEANMRKLKEGRIDLFIYDVQVAGFILSRLGLKPDDYETVYILEESPLCIAFNKNADDALIRRFQEALNAVIQNRPSSRCP